MSFSSLMKDTVSLLKKNGEKTDGIKASVQKRKIFINRSDVLIETGDLIQRKMSNGGEETYEVIDPGFYERHGSIAAHYQMDVKKLGLSEAKGITRHVDSLAKDSKNLESVDIPETQNMIKLFISHSSKDQELVEKLTELVKNALRLSSSEIRCTTIDGYRLSGGANTNEQIKREVRDTKAFIGLISFAATDSMYVLFELGARWGSDKHLLPLLAPGVSPDILKGPLSELNALSCCSASQLHQLVNDLATELGIKPEGAQAYQRYLDAILATPPSRPKPPLGVNPSLKNEQPKIKPLKFQTGSGKYVSASLRGKVTFDYSNNNGSYIIGAGDLAFETHWSKASDISIHTTNDSPSIADIGLALDVKEISEITDATRYDMSSRHRTPREGEIVVARNQNGYYAAMKVLDVKDRTRADDKDELTFEYVILSNRTADFTQLY